MIDRCENLAKLLEEQELVIRRHIQKHKYYAHKNNMEEAIADFVNKYAFIMREVFCNSSCLKSNECLAYKNYKANNGEINE